MSAPGAQQVAVLAEADAQEPQDAPVKADSGKPSHLGRSPPAPSADSCAGPSVAGVAVALGLGIAAIAAAGGLVRRLTKGRRSGRCGGVSVVRRRPDISKVFMSRVRLLPPPSSGSPPKLAGLKFAVSDVANDLRFDIEGHTCSIGKPLWKESCEPATSTAPLINRMVEGGAELVGTTICSSDFLSLHGRNLQYGNPPNPVAPELCTGGCHGGAASAVAGGLVDFALATEGFGGIRVPSACCGILGFMSSPKALPEEGIWNPAVNTNSLGWFARDPKTLAMVGEVALGGAGKPKDKLKKVMIAEDLFKMCHEKAVATGALEIVKRAAVALVGKDNVLQIKLGDLLNRNVPALGELGGPSPFENLQAAYTIVAAYECSRQSMKWAEDNPRVAEAMADSIDHGSQVSEEAYSICVSVMQDIRKVMYMTLNGASVLVLPTIGALPIKLDSSTDLQEQWAVDCVRMCSIAPMAACPQVTIPSGNKDGVPLSISLIAQHTSDSMLLGTAESLAPLLEQEAARKPEVDPEEVKRAKAAADLERRNERAESYKDAGNRAFKEGRFEEAIRDYGRAIEANPKKATYYSNRAMASLKVMNFAGAEEDCNQALKLELNAKTLLRRGTARLGLHDFDGSEKDFKQVIALEPQNRQARIELKNLRETKERFMEMQAAAKAMDGSGNAAVFGGVAPMLGGMISQEPTLGGGMQGL